MRAMVLERPGPISTSSLHAIELSDPWPAEHEVRVKIAACALSRRDLHVIEGDLLRPRLPLIPGHQIVGKIDVLGRNARRFKLGQRIGIGWLHQTCGECHFCHTQKENLCETARFTGYHAQGGLAEFAVVPESFAYAISDTLESSEAAPLVGAGVLGYRTVSRSQLPEGGNLGILGFGSSAQFALQLAKARRAQIFVVTPHEAHRRLAVEMGAVWVGDNPLSVPRKLDSAILFRSNAEWIPQALTVLRKGGTLALARLLKGALPVLDYEKHLAHEKNIHVVTTATRADTVALLAEAVSLRLKPLIKNYDLADANRALQDLKTDRLLGTAILTP